MAPPHLFLIQGKEGKFLEVLQNGCVLSAVLPSLSHPIVGGAGVCVCVWANTQCIEIYRLPWSATSCNLQSTLTLREKPACLCCRCKAFFVATAQSSLVCVCVCGVAWVCV